MKKRRRSATGALAVGAALGVATQADAAVFNVTNTNDSGAGSLRQAIANANADAVADTITFDAAVTGTITLTSGELSISNPVDIQGPGSATLAVSGNDASRIFYVYNAAPTPMDVTISGLSLTNAFSVVAGDPLASSGGAILAVGENLTLDDLVVDDAVAGGDGGGLAFYAADNLSAFSFVDAALSITNSTFSNNDAQYTDLGVPIDQGGCGGGIWAGGVIEMTLDDVDVTNNTARCSGGGVMATYLQENAVITITNSRITGNVVDDDGGGLLLYGFVEQPETVTIEDSTIAGNTAGYGGGLFAEEIDDITIRRSTISGNTAGSGGGITGYFSGLLLENTTIANNYASTYGGGVYALDTNTAIEHSTISGNTSVGPGAGVYAYYYSYVTVDNSIIANNTGYGDADVWSDGASSSIDVTFSLIEEPAGMINDNGGNVLNTDPQLGALQNNGGPTLTMKPAAASPAVNSGDPAFVAPPATDQRGFARIANGRTDMGAVELNPGTLQFSIAAQNVNESAGTATITVTRTGGVDGVTSAPITVTGASTATGGGTDYTFPGAIANFGDNDAAAKNFNITIVDDAVVDPAETIVLALGPTSGAATLGAPATHTVTIVDNDVVAVADLSVTKVLVPGSTTQYDDATFTITVTNNGPDAAANVVVNDTLPAQLTFVSATPSSGSCSGTTTITCNLGTLNASQSATITLVATMTGSGVTTNTATVDSDANDNDPTDNTGNVTFTILPASFENVPALDPRMQMVLAAILAAAALGILGKRL